MSKENRTDCNLRRQVHMHILKVLHVFILLIFMSYDNILIWFLNVEQKLLHKVIVMFY